MLSRSLVAAAAACGLSMTTAVAHADSFSDALAASKPILESRLRFESVDQPNLKSASALTWRNRIGLQTGEFHHLKLLVEFEDVRALRNDYNSNLNGKTAYAVVADPEVTELNRAQLTWTPSKAATVTLGRQRMAIDDGRFVGNSGWRQDEQTFDAARLDLKHGKWAVTYAYLYKINRTLAEAADWDSDSHVLNVTYAASDAFKWQVYDYALDFDTAPANSSQTYGVRLSGEKPLSKVKLTYAAHYAKQEDYGNNPAHFDLATYNLEAGLAYKFVSLKAGRETLEGNGVRGFIMPIGTAHAFRGWADAFSTGGNKTLPDGLHDLNLGVTFTGKTSKALSLFKNPTLAIIYHDFDTERTDQAVGREWDVQVTAGLTKNLSLMLKSADFERASASMPASRSKFWVGLEYKL